jgi:monovalent cation/proton antiporter MnhG/PhaG subunit
MTAPDYSQLAASALLILATLVMTIGVIGIFRMPNLFMKLHAASKSVFLGVCAILASTFMTNDPGILAKALLIAALLILTTPVAAYEIARAHARNQGLLPESGQTSTAEPGLSVLPSRQPHLQSGIE